MPFPAILVLANWLDEREELNPESRARADEALAAHQAGEAPVIVTSGWACNRYSRPIAEVVRDYLSARGVPHVAANPFSRETVGDAVFTKMAAPPLVVTSAYHADRVRKIFAFVYGQPVVVRAAPSEDTSELRAAEAASLAAFERTFEGISPGDYSGIWRRMAEAHSYYNGQVYPAITPEPVPANAL